MSDPNVFWLTMDNKRLHEENAKLRELALKNWHIALSEREALMVHGVDPDGGTYMAALDDEIATAKERMRELGIELGIEVQQRDWGRD